MAILCVGQLVADIVARPVDRLPHPGRCDLIEDLRLVAGGCAANTAGVLAKLGVNVSVVGMVGKDAMGDAVLADLAAVGVDTTRVLRSLDTPTSAVIVIVDSLGERSFMYRAGGNEKLTNEHIPDSAFSAVNWVHVGGAMKLAQLDLSTFLRRARQAGCMTSLDTDWDVSGHWMSHLDDALGSIDYLMTNQEEGSMLSGTNHPETIGKFLLRRGPRAVVIKRGELGSTLVTHSSCAHFPAYPADVVDTTCAGDSFVAGFLCGISRGLDLVQAMELGNATGALCTTDSSHTAVVSLEAAMQLALSLPERNTTTADLNGD